jgi:RNA polymerase sigma-70 factor (ECF subfamily)
MGSRAGDVVHTIGRFSRVGLARQPGEHGLTDVVTDVMPFDDVYRLHARRVLLFCLAQVHHHADAEDLVADVFEAAYMAYAASRPAPEVVLPWLLRIARNRVVDAHRRRTRRSAIMTRFFGNPDAYDPRDLVEDQVVRREEARLAIQCARRLAPRDRLLIGLRIMAGLSHAEIASVVGTSERTAAALTSRALSRLRRLYEAAA